MKRIGIYGLATPDVYGGAPVSIPCYVEVTQQLARGWMSLAGAMGGHTVVAKLLALFGTEEQKQKYLPVMATGEMRATMALTEPGGGSDLQNMTTTALRDGADLVINGSKTWISNARRSGLIALLCKTRAERDPTTHGHLGGSRRTRPRADGVTRLTQARLQGCRVLRADIRRLPGAGIGDSRRRAWQGLRAHDERP
jgi:alkylation response protein AidB-like acyl-CoA dehydrogenase